MNKKLTAIRCWGLLVSACLFMSACGESDASVPAQGGSNVQTKSATGVIPEHQMKALNDAKSIEKVIQDADTERRKQLDSQM